MRSVLPTDCETITNPQDYRADLSDAAACYQDGADRAKAQALASTDETTRRAYESVAKNWKERGRNYSAQRSALDALDRKPKKKEAACSAALPSVDFSVKPGETESQAALRVLYEEGDVSRVEAARRQVCENRY
ncbi:hypothetical protein K1X76_09005 [bacterium]|nr:hypothetical protein [bacterium]